MILVPTGLSASHPAGRPWIRRVISESVVESRLCMRCVMELGRWPDGCIGVGFSITDRGGAGMWGMSPLVRGRGRAMVPRLGFVEWVRLLFTIVLLLFPIAGGDWGGAWGALTLHLCKEAETLSCRGIGV